MSLLSRALLRARAVANRRSLERDMQEEMHAHLERATERLIARGLSPADARLAAQREFGNIGVLQEEARDARGARWVESLVGDIRFALRHFARTPLVTATIVFVLALGIGANSALFSVLQAFTMRPAPAVPKDDALVRIYGFEQASRAARTRLRGFTFPELLALEARSETFAGVAGWTSHDVIVDRHDGSGPRGIVADFVTPNFWSTLRVALAAGPGFATDPRTPDFAAVISFRLAEDWFPSPQSAVGQRIDVNNVPVRIAGVAPPRFQGAVASNGSPEIWIPISARAEVAHISPGWLSDSPQLSVFARLAPSVTRERATSIASDLAVRMRPDSASRVGLVRTAKVLPIWEPPPIASPDNPLVVFAAIGVIAILILLVACTNVSSLLVAAAVGRRHEIAVRLSLGASRTRLLRQLLTESAFLAVAGGLAGLVLYWWITMFLAAQVETLGVEIAPDLMTVAFTMLFAIGTGVLFGLSPALHATRVGVATALRDSGAGVTSRSRLQRSFVVAQIVLSQPLLVLLALLLVAALPERTSMSKGVPDHVIAAGFRPLSRTGAADQRQPAVESLIRRLVEQPEIASVVPEASAFAVRNVVLPRTVQPSDGSESDVLRVHVEGASPGYFDLLDVPIILGRDISFADTAGVDYAIVIDSDLARLIWGETNPLGQRLASTSWNAGSHDSVAMVVVGVFDASHATTRGGDWRVYTANGRKWRKDALLVRTRGPARAYIGSLRSVIRAETPNLPITRVETLADVSRRDRRQSLQLLAAVAAAGSLALLVASIGLYGVVSLAVGQRRREIGIRIALGGRPSRVAGMFFASGVRLSALALLIGLPITSAALQLAVAGGILIFPTFNVPVIGVSISLIVLAVAMAASWFPARRAAKVDPSLALRVE